jgi:hypothetical protein
MIEMVNKQKLDSFFKGPTAHMQKHVPFISWLPESGIEDACLFYNRL